jgi:hypothetical protein
MRITILILLLIASSRLLLADAAALGDAIFTQSLFEQYEKLQRSALQRYLTLEDKADGLTSDFRNLLGDRKIKNPGDFREKGKTLPDPQLLQAVIVERKRLENETSFIEELRNSPLLVKQFEKKIAANLLMLEASVVLLTYAEYLDEFNRGVRKLPKPSNQNDIGTMKVLAATLTAFDYPKIRKTQMALSNSQILSLVPKESQATLKLIEMGLGKMTEDSLLMVDAKTSSSKRKQLEVERLERTHKLISLMDKLSISLIVANRGLFDEYQYRILKLNQKLTESKKAN